MDLLASVQMRVVPPTVPPATRPLPPLWPITVPIGAAVVAGPLAGLPTSCGVTRTRRPLLRRATEQHPRQHRDLLDQLPDPGLRHHQPLLGSLGTLTPERHLGDVHDQRIRTHLKIKTKHLVGQDIGCDTRTRDIRCTPPRGGHRRLTSSSAPPARSTPWPNTYGPQCLNHPLRETPRRRWTSKPGQLANVLTRRCRARPRRRVTFQGLRATFQCSYPGRRMIPVPAATLTWRVAARAPATPRFTTRGRHPNRCGSMGG